MKGYWAQPSLSRDFTLLAAAILFVFLLISGWITYNTYTQHSHRITAELESESQRIERALAGEMESANYMLSALGKQIVLDKDRDLVRLAQMLKAFDSKGNIYSIFSWISPDQHVVVSSNRGVLDSPGMDVSDRDYVQQAMAEPWKMRIGRPIEGRVSERWVIPVAMGLTDYTGKFIGTIMVSIDINTLTERLSNLVRREGISFAIVSKTLIPLTQVSDDKDFVTNNFPTQKLGNVNFSSNPSGLITGGNFFLGTGTYSYYRVSADYPYIILLGYDLQYTGETVHGMLLSRLLQAVLIALFLVLFLWVMRLRMIRPVLDMTAIAASVAKGEPYTPLPFGGPVEIEGLSTQIRRIGEYIEETKRIEDELRNKMFMLKKAKERAELDRRSKTEFLAYICQEMRTPLNNIIGFAQVMRDQLYGPIENRKYRQYAADIYQTGNGLLNNLQDLLSLSRLETDMIEFSEKPLDVGTVVNKALRSVSERAQAEKVTIKSKLRDGLPRLLADEFRLQQIFSNLFIYAMQHTLPGSSLLVDVRVISEHRDLAYFAAIITSRQQEELTDAKLLELAERTGSADSNNLTSQAVSEKEQVGLQFELARSLVAMHQGNLHIIRHDDGGLTIAIFFGNNRIQVSENQG